MDADEQKEQELSILASFKDTDALYDIADKSCCNEDEDGGYWAVMDGIQAGLRASKSEKEIWTVSHYEPGETETDFDTGLFFIFIGISFEDLKKKIEALPDL